jgi:hypothetical protein
MNKKILPLLIVGILVLSGLGAVAIDNDTTNDYKTVEKYITLSLSSLVIKDRDSNYIDVSLEDTSAYLMTPGDPVLPKVVKSVELPFGVTNVKVEVTPINVKEQFVEKEIRPGPAFLPLETISNEVALESEKDEGIYTSEEAYPSSWYSYRVVCGLNDANKIVTHVLIDSYPVKYVPATGKLFVAESFDIKITYDDPETNPFPLNTAYDMVIIAPSKFSSDLQKLVDHKNSLNPPIETKMVKLDEIYGSVYFPLTGGDIPEQIKYFIKNAIEAWGIKYVLLVGGLDSLVWGNPRENSNYGIKDWNVPVRYNNIYDNPKFPLAEAAHDPGVISDLYYADIYKEGGAFENWDPNGDGLICGWGKDGYVNDTGYDVPYKIDWYPDVCVGRLTCRNVWEVRAVVDKIIKYETGAYGQDWFNDIVAITGDGFLDQTPLDIEWDVKNLPNGKYTIYAQSTNIDMVSGYIDVVNVTVDNTKPTVLTFNHDDHLILKGIYPNLPIAEITSPSEGDILGYNDSHYEPGPGVAYCNEFSGWANLDYINGVMYIRGKSYDPRPNGFETSIHVWIKNSAEQQVFDQTVTGLKMYYEGEVVTSEEIVKGGPGAFYYMTDFDKEYLWTSNGKFKGESDVKVAFDKGSGFIFFSGHGAPNIWADHLAGIPGNRIHASVTGLQVIKVKSPPYFPMNKLTNDYKNPIVVVGGCHNSQFNVSAIATILRLPSMWTYGLMTPECWSEWLVKLSKRGSIATIGNTGLGYGVIGDDCNIAGLDGGICIEFFKQYGQEGKEILGDAFVETLRTYVTNFDMNLQEHGKSLSQWVLLGDPSLKIGGYENAQQEASIQVIASEYSADGIPGTAVDFQASTTGVQTPLSYEWSFDKDGDNIYDTFATGKNVEQTWDNSGVYWVQLKTIYSDHEEISYSVAEIELEQLVDQPAKPVGATGIRVGVPHSYKTATTDPNNYDLTYLYDWGDETYGIIGPVSSGQTVSASHSWSKKGVYEIKVMAIDENGYWSEWSNPLTVSVAKDKSRELFNQPLILFLQNLLENHPNNFPLLRHLLEQ